MSEPSTAIPDPSDPTVQGRNHLPRAGHDVPDPTLGGLAAYYRLRCLALEATVVALESQLDRKERRLQDVITRYENVLQERESGEEFVATY